MLHTIVKTGFVNPDYSHRFSAVKSCRQITQGISCQRPSGISICSHFLLRLIRTSLKLLLSGVLLPLLTSTSTLSCHPRLISFTEHVLFFRCSVASVVYFCTHPLQLLRPDRRIAPWRFHPFRGVLIKLVLLRDYWLRGIQIIFPQNIPSALQFFQFLGHYFRICSPPWLLVYCSPYRLMLVLLLAPPACIGLPLFTSTGSAQSDGSIRSYYDHQAVYIHDSLVNGSFSHIWHSIPTSRPDTWPSPSTHADVSDLYHPIDRRSSSHRNGSAQTSTESQLVSKRNRVSVALITLVLIVCTVMLLLSLAFWWACERKTRHKFVSAKETATTSPHCGPTIEHEDASVASEPTIPISVHKAAESNGSAVHRLCIPFTQCLQRCLRLFPRAEPNHFPNESIACRTVPTGVGDPSTGKDLSLQSTESSLAPKASSLSHHNISVTTSPFVSGSPSLAHRRRGTPLPRLITPITSPTPIIETCTVMVQPTDVLCFSDQPPESASTNLVETKCMPHIDTDSVFPSPLLQTAPDVTQLQSAFHNLRSTREPFDQMHASPLTYSTALDVSTTTIVHAANSVAGPHILRNRAKGLLESRRGSHASLTLSLSPLTSLAPPTEIVNRGGSSLGESSDLVGTGDRDCTSCNVNLLCYSSRTPCSECKSKDYFESCPTDGSGDNNVIPVTQLDYSHPGSPSDPHNCERLSSLVAHHSQCCHPCHHNRRYAHLHSILSPHHRLCTHHHCRLDCVSGPLSCQRSRELEQLMHASLPLTLEDLVSKLHSNSSAMFHEFWNIPMNHTSKRELPLAGIGHKNRYQSILPNFSTRVLLPMINNDPTTTYINANYITGYGGRPNAFIATQGPMSHTIYDFWRMVWHSRAPAIVMITKLVEKQGVKCELYLPNSSPGDGEIDSAHSSSFADTPLSFGSPGASCSSTSPVELDQRQSDSGTASVVEQAAGFSRNAVTLRECSSSNSSHLVALPGSSQTFGDIHVEIASLQDFICYSMRVLRLRRASEERTVIHFWYTAWPDHSSPDTTPTSANHLLQLVEAAESCREGSICTSLGSSVLKLNAPQRLDAKTLILAPPTLEIPTANTEVQELPHPPHVASVDPTGPLVVHCSAGLGRTGCFIALCIGCAQLRHEGIVDVLRIVSRLRLERGGMVQTNEQYEFIHHALAAYQSFRRHTSLNTDTLR